MIHCECFCVCCDTQTFVLPDGATGEGLACPSCGRHLAPHTLRPFGEADWLACDDPAVLAECAWEKVTDRKRRLFLCACCRRLWHRLPDPRSRAAVEAAERFADGQAGWVELHRACDGARAVNGATAVLTDVTWLAVEAATQGSPYPPLLDRVRHRGRNPGVALAPLLRDLFGNPFRPVHLDPAWLAWEDGTVRKLAEGIYQDQAFDRLPVLADALEEAGCADEQVLAHCRAGGPHARGCWLLDLLLGKG
jgi:hypothetical protein